MTAEETVARLEELEELLGHEQHHVSSIDPQLAHSVCYKSTRPS